MCVRASQYQMKMQCEPDASLYVDEYIQLYTNREYFIIKCVIEDACMADMCSIMNVLP